MESESATYDVFISYHWRDHEPVEEIARFLRAQDSSVFLDRWYLVPGQPWVQNLDQLVAGSRSLAIFLGPHGMGALQQREANLAMDRWWRARISACGALRSVPTARC
jgi:hypothetical protein